MASEARSDAVTLIDRELTVAAAGRAEPENRRRRIDLRLRRLPERLADAERESRDPRERQAV